MSDDLRDEVAALRKEVSELREMIAKLKAPPKAARPAPAPAPKVQEGIDEQTVFIISAAIAAFLGKKATIRSISHVRSQVLDVWRLQGRVAIQGSHRIR